MSAEEARQMGMLDARDQVTLNRDYLLQDAKQTVLGLQRAGYRPPRRRTMRLPGEGGYANLLSALQMMHAAHHLNGPTFAHEILTTAELVAALPISSHGDAA